jgi:hypothetical protein
MRDELGQIKIIQSKSLGGVGPQLVHVLGKHSLVFFLAGQGAKYNRTIREYFESVDCYILY